MRRLFRMHCVESYACCAANLGKRRDTFAFEMSRMRRAKKNIEKGNGQESEIMLGIVLVILGGALGSMWRYSWSGFFAERLGETFPIGTFVVNMVGSMLIGVFSGVIARVASSADAALLQQFLVIGICGGLTTFSSFSLQTYNLVAEGRWLSALANIFFSTGFCLAGVAIGWQIAQWLSF